MVCCSSWSCKQSDTTLQLNKNNSEKEKRTHILGSPSLGELNYKGEPFLSQHLKND